MQRHTRGSATTTSDGFSLVEVVIAMMLFAVLAVGLLPLITGVTQSTVTNAEIVRARAAALNVLGDLESRYPTDDSAVYGSTAAPGPTDDCAALPGLTPTKITVDDALTVLLKSGDCPSAYPGTVPIHLEVHNEAGKSLLSWTTSVRVTQ